MKGKQKDRKQGEGGEGGQVRQVRQVRQDLVLHVRCGVDAGNSGAVQDGDVVIRDQNLGDVDEATAAELHEGRKKLHLTS